MTDLEKLADLLDRAHHSASCVAARNESEGEALEEEARYLLANGVRVLPVLHGDTLPTTREQALKRLGLKSMDENAGEWIPVELTRNLGSFTGIRCSLCGYEKIKSSLVKAPNYCENCGAKMKDTRKNN